VLTLSKKKQDNPSPKLQHPLMSKPLKLTNFLELGNAH
jgi:hypothetical protein